VKYRLPDGRELPLVDRVPAGRKQATWDPKLPCWAIGITRAEGTAYLVTVHHGDDDAAFYFVSHLGDLFGEPVIYGKILNCRCSEGFNVPHGYVAVREGSPADPSVGN